jgi:hypothetical protein
MLYDHDTFTRGGYEFRVTFPYDDWHRTPWDDCDGYGPVSEWTSRDKRPGERILNQDGRSYRFYDWQEAIKIAKREGWGPPCGRHTNEFYRWALRLGRLPTKGEIAEAAVEADFDRLRRWCNDEWQYVGVVVELVSEPERGDSVWGIESDAYDYLEETAYELADRIVDELNKEKTQRETQEAREMEASRPDMYL